MITEKILCDRCEKEVNGGGFSISTELIEGYGFRMSVSSILNQTGGEHTCGKECLMKMLNSMVDGITKKEGGVHETTALKGA